MVQGKIGVALINIATVTYGCNGLLFKDKIAQKTVQNASILLVNQILCECMLHCRVIGFKRVNCRYTDSSYDF